jgi:hypothetical protein
MLWGLAIGGAPILIHLLHRRRFREVQWAAMRFLIAATRKQARRLRLEQLLLLAVRTLIVLLTALALARPTVETFGEYFRAEGPRHRIIVVDASFSMGYESGGRTRFDRAKELGRQVAAAAHQGDALQLVRIGESMPRVIVKQPAYQSAAVLEEISQLPLMDERVDVSVVLNEIDSLLGMVPDISRKEVYFVTDLQTAAWSPSDSTEASRVKAGLKKLSERAKLVFLDVGDPGTPNTAITSLRAGEGFILSGRSVPLSATIRNFGTLGATGQLVEMFVDDRLTDTRQIDMPAETDVRVDFAPAFPSGEHRVEVRIKPDGLKVDDSRRLVIPVRDELQVLLVNGKPSGEPMGNATDFLKLALAPELPNRLPISPIRPTVIREGELLGTDLTRFDCVFICNVATLTDREAELLKGYLEGGGGVIFCLGDQVRPDSYNEVLYRGGVRPNAGTGGTSGPILPARLVEKVGDAKRKEVAFEFDPGDFNHPIVRPFQGNPGAGLELTKTFSYIKTQINEDRGARVALRFSNGDPAIVDAPYGRGRVVLVTTSVDREWSTWAVWGHSLIPLMHETVGYAVSSRWSERETTVGQPLVCHLPIRSSSVSATLQSPGGESSAPTASADGRSVITEPTSRAGFHRLVLGPPLSRTESFAVNVDAQESNLASLKADDLRTDIVPGVEFTYLTDWEESPLKAEKTVRIVSTSSGLSRSLLIAAFCLLVVEQVMAWRFVPGLLLLMLASVAAMSLWAWSASPISGAILLALGAAGIGLTYSRRSAT